jgi:serine/threonine-protein kinase
MCSVYKGLHTGLEQDVAIKFLLPEFFDDRNFKERFVKEAKIQAKLSHPNIVKTLNYLDNENEVLMVMEYVNGETLDVLLKKSGALPPERAVMIFESVLQAIDFMHSKGVVHRDIKPSNIMISYDGYVKIMDFGIAKVVGENSKTKTGIRMGTLWYMSPEQIKGEQATVLSDIYSLGITLYQMVTGTIPFDGETEFEIMKSHIEKEPVPPWKVNPELDKGLGGVILRAMAKNPKNRYQSVREFLFELRQSAVSKEVTKLFASEIEAQESARGRFLDIFTGRQAVVAAVSFLLLSGIAVFAYTNITADKPETQAVKTAAPATAKMSAALAVKPDGNQAHKDVTVPAGSQVVKPVDTASSLKASGGKAKYKAAGSNRRAKAAQDRKRKKNNYAAANRQKSASGSIDRPASGKEAGGLKTENEGKWSIRK